MRDLGPRRFVALPEPPWNPALPEHPVTDQHVGRGAAKVILHGPGEFEWLAVTRYARLRLERHLEFGTFVLFNLDAQARLLALCLGDQHERAEKPVLRQREAHRRAAHRASRHLLT